MILLTSPSTVSSKYYNLGSFTDYSTTDNADTVLAVSALTNLVRWGWGSTIFRSLFCIFSMLLKTQKWQNRVGGYTIQRSGIFHLFQQPFGSLGFSSLFGLLCQWLVECGVNVWKWHNGPIRGRKWSNFKRIHQIIYQQGSKWKINVSNFLIVKYLFWLYEISFSTFCLMFLKQFKSLKCTASFLSFLIPSMLMTPGWEGR